MALCVVLPRNYFRHDGTLYGPAQVVDIGADRVKQLVKEGKVASIDQKNLGPKAYEKAREVYRDEARRMFRSEFNVGSDRRVSDSAVEAAYGEVALGPGEEEEEESA